MTEQTIILTRLLEKYEKSRHLLEPGRSNRRVMLRVEKKELPEYDHETAAVRDAFNQAARSLEGEGLVSLVWLKNRPVLSGVVLRLEQVDRCYRAVGKAHPKHQAEAVARMVRDALGVSRAPWVAAWRDDVCKNAETRCTVPGYCKRDTVFLSKLLAALAQYDELRGEPITMRGFSSRCYHNSKIFEREVRDTFLRIAEKYHPGLEEACEHGDMGVRDKLAYLGIYARPELYELSGRCSFTTTRGSIDAGAAYPFGIALPSTLVDLITEMDLGAIGKTVLIENKTNYDEYLLSELEPGTLAVYHGGFLSPQKRKLFSKIQDALPQGARAYFWADIDLGGFQMFTRLREVFPDLEPMRMSGEDVAAHCGEGLARPKEYLNRLEQALAEKAFPMFEGAIREILRRGVTIEQEAFLQ